ncbi:RING protein [Emericellopsis cladophorae]|uniref:RING protein n=1 Tax=Emericellopsis cladophorae TaxID=2686198 RepID=A0A9Q0BB57_9HYPO|nr:RING protein [Emericellopsis cladophorae]KAI6779477.1 RING protein [Emericellopsis cladophorae]
MSRMEQGASTTDSYIASKTTKWLFVKLAKILWCSKLLKRTMATNKPSRTILNCNVAVISTGASVFARYTNEGGLQPNLDILPAITEEAYLLNQPEARPARAFQVMCAEGDIEGMVELLAALDEDEDEIASATSILQYQDPLSGQKSSLHIAVENAQVDVAMLLLWLSSTAPPEAFPDVARQTAERFGLSRLTAQTGDIRLLHDSNGLTAEQYAQRTSGPLAPLLVSGLLSPGA